MEAFATGLVPVIGDSKKSATKYFALDGRSVFRNGKGVSAEVSGPPPLM